MPAMFGKVLKRGVSAATVALLCVVPSTGSVNRRANTRFHTDQELPKPCEAPEQLLPSTRQNSRLLEQTSFTAQTLSRGASVCSKEMEPAHRVGETGYSSFSPSGPCPGQQW
ncbi:hypothetical protein PPTG_23964 [Phytophthora nicotianae INRA-310]|uniref:RxLR effector protein n=1 Tax=Phytophthora nicotianae (strain INRA-310) TaxID=761204 RepID=W2PLT3_PHYN3|nr:hypothetical protein PPTG_23964 [Phytophthora nicotianae INRA-310]ETN01963.1 hypothetical protein PPTG_23964 [Phytophthora nicotianae INRA-310]